MALTQEQAEHFHAIHGRIQDDSRYITEDDLKLAVNAAKDNIAPTAPPIFNKSLVANT
ncbi:hypothetical protein [Shewanella sp. JNE4-2]|uniref:hypothetical protein n=1 Tax=Shewanella sp. JNE4-2 TaxID=2983532 RepID=UPI002003A9BB|nr:hypothetical protein [Shewanella sp. JNE4-2]MCK7657743.1 hypothetical protein [Shewanella sp. JNE4-2]